MSVRPNRRWLTLACMWVLLFSIYVSVLSTSIVLGDVAEDMGLSSSQSGTIISAPLITLAIFALAGGLIGDRVGSKRTAGIGILIFGAASLGRGFSPDFPTILCLSLMMGTGWGLVYPNLPKLVKQVFGKVGGPTGVYSTGIFVGGTFGLATTPFVLSSTGGWRGVFCAWGALALAAALMWWALVRVPERKRTTTGRIDYNVLGNRYIWMLAIFFGFAGNMTFYVATGWLPTFFAEKGLDPTTGALITSMLTVISIPSVFLIPLASDRSGARKPYMWAGSIAAAAAFLGVAAGPTALYWACTVVAGVALTSTFIMGLIVPVELVSEEKGASASGLVISIGYVIGALGPTIAGWLRDLTGSLSPALLMLSAVLIFSAGLSTRLPETGKKSR